ncbi:hypothetical protein [Romboutsia lituseburensis]|uniref:Uncharacterized protein n=1 Tax=Romboutsia lituseburensis DSM 797 TaxID=1121325 RepID=A0A1G9TZB5_9FIRM|nr:hypothetical protein [Romboutsia lituseburensis]CEH34715.1 Hypothetical protein RLITU_2132 [Romboutsia lituseburensis]SDM52923.1 hypothetical protein SAMN04515677_11424 [Romboutsia lituseburensis DSM 797]
MFIELYKHLKEKGFDVYSIGQHEGICSSPYLVIKENTEMDIVGTSFNNELIDIIIYYPKGSYSKLNPYLKSVKGSMAEINKLKRAYDPTPIVIDDEKEAYTTSFSYKKIKKKEGI